MRALMCQAHGLPETLVLRDMPTPQPEPGAVRVRVKAASVNFPDSLIIQNLYQTRPPLPFSPGSEAAGVVDAVGEGVSSLRVGDRVAAMTTWGAFAEAVAVQASRCFAIPDAMPFDVASGFTMVYGTALHALAQRGRLQPGETLLVLGAAGGVGSVATAILANLGHQVAGVTGRPETADYLKSLGATQSVAREELNETVKRPLESETWAGCIDAVGGEMLARVLGQMKYGGSVAAVGLAGGAGLPATVIPFLLRGVNLLGIDSVMQPYDNRLRAWQRIGKGLPLSKLEDMVVPATLSDLPKLGADILNGQVRGRVVVDVNG